MFGNIFKMFNVLCLICMVSGVFAFDVVVARVSSVSS